MPLMTLISTAVDHISVDPEPTIKNILNYLPTDTACYLAPAEDRILRKRQEEHLTPLREKLQEALGVKFGTSESVLGSVAHPSETMVKIQNEVNQMDPFTLAALQCATMECKSILIGLSLVMQHIEPEQAAICARLEEEFNVEVWGLVEGGHDLDRLACAVQLAASSSLMLLKNDSMFDEL
mmetsp:Transcript_20891/g.30251  ORF Transcript_20891/g.30251 Transcript_20891/m.30251 type:complete len:181 (-) Transcript_20891:34-576(-)